MEAHRPTACKKKHRRSWRQYSLSTLLVVVTIASVVLGRMTSRAEQQRRAVAAIRELGGTVTYDFELKARADSPGPDWLCRTVGVDCLADVVRVDVVRMTDETCSHLSALRELQSLTLCCRYVTDAGLAHLAGLTNLQSLDLFGTQVTDAGLVHLEGLVSLQKLWLNKTQVTDEGCDKLRQALPNCSVYH